jgi:DNA-binding transcriptional ArsR family regulator
MTDPRVLHRHIIRTVLALCRLAERGADEDAREDLTDACLALFDAYLSGDAAIREWCNDADALVGRLDGSVQGPALLRAQARLLRLRASVAPAVPVASKPAAAPKPVAPKVNTQAVLRELGANARRVLQWLKDNPGARTRELVTKFDGELSDRTVMRLLKELAKAGLVRRTQRDGAAIYEVIDTQA